MTVAVYAFATPPSLDGANENLDRVELSSNQIYPLESTPCDDTGTYQRDEIWESIDEFFDTAYLIFPIVSYVELTSRLVMQPSWVTVPDLRTLLYSIRLVNSAARYRMDHQNGDELLRRIVEVESSRQAYDFADPATLDAVFCSLALFTANSVLGKHGRAFLYLNEAQILFDDVEPSGCDEEQRKSRIEQVLHNTESATLAIYGRKQKKLQARKRPTCSDTVPARVGGVGLGDRLSAVATQLLQCLTRIHLARDADDISKVNLGSDAILSSLGQHPFSRIQSADVMITRQWQLSCKLLTSSEEGNGCKEPPKSMMESLGVVAMSWICVLREGELRIVGLGKLAELAVNIFKLPGGSHQDSLRGLTGAVMKEDHEGWFALPLADVILSAAYNVPPLMETQKDQEIRCSMLARLAAQDASTSLETELVLPQIPTVQHLGFGDSHEDAFDSSYFMISDYSHSEF
ncbi:unnamed protein product [Clonostachys rosea]|uniref:Transcription factor domain-containing protein n=1 Tax=Bionectria ochroleuca TaxID=29856 RepID=A0ABY6TXF1_BIOOC|nr:unnamed protein product [Clonostachys rosea]